jgi:NitT/TauT family transport system substrate-binding protein
MHSASFLTPTIRGVKLACMALLACLAMALTPQPAAAQQEVKLNEVLRSLFYAPEYVALRIGAFEQEGLKIVGPKTT